MYENRVEVMCWLKEDEYIITGGNDRVMRIWRVIDGLLVKSLEAIHHEKIMQIEVLKDNSSSINFVTAGMDDFIAIWNIFNSDIESLENN